MVGEVPHLRRNGGDLADEPPEERVEGKRKKRATGGAALLDARLDVELELPMAMVALRSRYKPRRAQIKKLGMPIFSKTWKIHWCAKEGDATATSKLSVSGLPP